MEPKQKFEQLQNDADEIRAQQLKSSADDGYALSTNFEDSSLDVLSQADKAMALAASAPDAMLDKILGGHYQIESMLGAGGMSVVYKARHLLLNKYVAIKIISRERVFDNKAIQRLVQEAKAAAALSHPNIVGVREFGIDQEGHPFMVMDFVEGESLEQLIRREGKIEPTRAFEIIAQVCEGLQHAHEKGIVHRDIKPGNIVLSREGGIERALILDFGIAKILNQPDGQNLTQTGEVFGSPLYMSPEQCLGNKLDARSDIYSLGCVFYEMLTGKPPFKGEGSLQTLLKHIEAEPELDPSLPRAAATPILRALEKDVTKRYQSVTELARDLDKAASSLSTDTGTGIRWKRRARRKSRWSKQEKIVAWCLIPLCVVLASAGAFCIGWIYCKPEWRNTLDFAKSYAEQHNDVEAMDSFARALALAQKEHDGGDAEWQVRRDLGEYYFSEAERNQSIPDADKAAKQLSQALKIALLKGTTFDKAHILDKLGESEYYLHEYGAAEGHFKDAVYFRHDRPGPQGKWLAGTLMRQGDNYRDEKKYDLAQQSMLKAIEVLESGGEKIYRANYYRQLAYVEELMADYTQANKHYDQCIKLIEATTGKDDPRIEDALRGKIDVLEKLGRKKEADMLRARVH